MYVRFPTVQRSFVLKNSNRHSPFSNFLGSHSVIKSASDGSLLPLRHSIGSRNIRWTLEFESGKDRDGREAGESDAGVWWSDFVRPEEKCKPIRMGIISMFVRYLRMFVFSVVAIGGIYVSPANAIDRLLSVGQGNTVLLAAGDVFLIDLQANHSYACDGIPESATSEFDWRAQMIPGAGSPAEILVGKKAGDITPQITGESGGADDNRITFTPTTSNRFSITVDDAEGGGESVRVRCFDTTLHSGFNTNVNDFNFLELTNVTNATVTGKVTAITADGTTVINGAGFSISAQRRADIDLHTPAGADKYGLVIVTHDGPVGALKGGVSQYSGTVSSFELTGFVPLTPTEQAP